MDGNNKSKLKDKQQQKQKSMEVINMNTNNNINNSSHSSSGKATNTIGTGTVNINAGGTSSSSTNKPKEKRSSWWNSPIQSNDCIDGYTEFTQNFYLYNDDHNHQQYQNQYQNSCKNFSDFNKMNNNCQQFNSNCNPYNNNMCSTLSTINNDVNNNQKQHQQHHYYQNHCNAVENNYDGTNVYHQANPQIFTCTSAAPLLPTSAPLPPPPGPTLLLNTRPLNIGRYVSYNVNQLNHQQHQQQQQQQPTTILNQVITPSPLSSTSSASPSSSSPLLIPSYFSTGMIDMDTHAPCQGPRPWNYAYCYGYYGQPACQYSDIVDIEDFMSNEKRKEKSRDAARCRRSRETEIFAELANVLPLRREDVEQLDKASIMRLSIAFLKVREMLKLFPKLKDIKIEKTQDENNPDKKQKIFDILDGPKSNKLLTQSMDGFLLILSSEGDVTYVSENISEYLGISQIDILGQQIWEYSHQCDHDELKEALNMRRNNILSNDLIKSDNNDHSVKSDNNENNNEENDEKNKSNKINMKNIINENLKTDHRDFYIRLKCTLTSRGRSVNIKSASYKVIHMTGHIIMNNAGERILVAIGRPLPHPSNIEIPLGSTTFLTKHSLDMKFTYADDNMLSLLGYKPEDLLNKSLYDYHYAVDSESLMATFKSVLSKGQGETNRYRFLGKYGGYSWVVTQATIVYDKQKPQSVVCVNYAISNLENDNEIYSCEQLEASNNKRKTAIETATTKLIPQQQQQQKQQQQQHQQQKKLEDKQFDCILEQKKSIPCELLSTGKSAQNNLKLSPTAIKTNVIKSPIKLTSDIVNLNENKILNQTELEKNCYQQQQQQKPQQTQQQIFHQQQQQQKYLLESNKTKILQTLQNIDNNIKPDLIKCENHQFSNNNQLYRESSLSPIRHTFNKCSINSPTSILRGDNIQHHLQQQKPIAQRGGPKTVTASVFKKVSIPPTKLNFSSSSIIGGGTGSGILNRPQSVTASVLTPISSLSKAKQNSSKFSFNNCGKTQQNRQQQQQINHNQLQQQQLRTEDMNKGFSMFLDDPPELTMLKEEPDDLTHLAPTAGDTCLPLDDSTPLFGEMLDSLILPDTYGTLLSDDINSLDSQQSTNNNSNNNNNNNNNNFNCNITNNNNSSNNSLNNKSHIDPFINYRDESSDTTGSPHLLSPGASKSPEVSSIPSLCSPNSLSQDDEFAFMTMNDEIDLTMRAPYIPMNEQDDLPLLTEDLMWSAFSEELHKDIKEALQIEIKNNINNNINNNNNNNNNMNLNISCNSINSSNNNNNNLSCINNSNNSNNNIESNNETSSLAALLCNGVNQNATTTTALSLNSILNQQHQQQQQQQQQSQLQQNTKTSSPSPSSLSVSSLLGQITTNNELSKKRKYELTSDDDDNLTNDRITTVPSADLVDTIDAFGQVFNNKNSPNIDCWTINDLLQISPLSSGSTTATTISGTTFNNQNSSGLDTKQQQQHQQNIIVNTATIPCTTTATATFHVPLITFQHNGNKINLTRSSSIGSINGCNTTTKNGIGIGINIDEQLQQQQCNNKKSNMTKILTATSNNNNNNNTNGNISQVLNKSSNININITTTGGSNSSNGGGNEITTVTLPQQITTGNSYNNKRHLNISTSLDSKRVKNSSSIEIQTSPTLLQQLMAPTLQKHKGKSDKSQNSRWHSESDGGGSGGGSDDGGNTDDGSNNVNGQRQQQQNIGNNNNNMSLSSSSSSPSNSVLKNLLVSGCDGVFSSNQQQQKQHLQSADDVMMIDDNSLDSMNDSYQHLKLTQESNINNYAKPLQCKISNPNLTLNETSILSANNNLLHYFGSNPMIGGGPGLLPSPPIPILLDSSTENRTKNNVQVTTNCGDNFNLSVDGGGGGDGGVTVGAVGGNRVMNNSPSPNYMMAMHSPKLMAFNDSDSDSGIECGGGGIGRSNNFGRNFLTRSSTTDKIISKLTQESPTKNPRKMTNLQPNIDCDLYNDDSMSLSGDEAPPPLEPTDFILESSAILTPAILSPTPAGSCLSSPKLMTTAINKTTIISPNHNNNNNPDIKLSPNSPYSPIFNVETAVNPLANSSFLMDLCSDDYAMSDLLQDNEITKVLNDWNTEMT